MNTLENSSKTGVKNLWKEWDEIHQIHTTIFSTDTTIKSDETNSFFKKINIMDLEKRKEVYGVCGECNEPDNSSNMSNDFLNEIKYYISGHFSCVNTVICYGMTQDPDTQNYMMVLQYYESGNLRNNVMNDLVEYKIKIPYLFWIIDGLSAIHDAGKVHKDLHSGNILVHRRLILIKPVNSIDYLSSFQEPISSTSANPISERLNYELSELDLNQDDIF
ncbi:kinase-like domain-containing protein [Rhizophagus irregularis DAOM 181602=DAOM 197198]|nr:kinase-like domain-containing protein [Rhizophagus irregularis DAOM 181602=DAOM 197198]